MYESSITSADQNEEFLPFNIACRTYSSNTNNLDHHRSLCWWNQFVGANTVVSTLFCTTDILALIFFRMDRISYCYSLLQSKQVWFTEIMKASRCEGSVTACVFTSPKWNEVWIFLLNKIMRIIGLNSELIGRMSTSFLLLKTVRLLTLQVPVDELIAGV